MNLRNSTRRTSKLSGAQLSKDVSVLKHTLRSTSGRAIDSFYNKSLASKTEVVFSTPSSSSSLPLPISMSLPKSQLIQMPLPSTEFFIADKDSLLLSESDIFQVNNSEPSSSIQINISKSNSNSKKSNSYRKIYDKEEVNFETDNIEQEHEHEQEQGIEQNIDKENTHNNLDILSFKQQFNSSNCFKNDLSSLKRQISYPIAARSLHPPEHNHVTLSEKDKQLDKGLRHFSAKVCAKVEEKGITTYNEVADDLVQQIGLELGKCDHKNIRRRVYDALNVLMAIDIIRKEKKEIRWLGLPNEIADDLRELEIEKAALQERINEKSRNMREVLRRCISLKNLIDRNNEANLIVNASDKLSLPFILISAARDCHVHCEMLEDRTQYFFEFNTSFQINEDIELMRLMGLDTGKVEKIKSFFPKELVAQVLMLCLNINNNLNSADLHRNFESSNYAGGSLTPVNNSVFAPIINTEDLNLGDLDSFNSSSLSSSL